MSISQNNIFHSQEVWFYSFILGFAHRYALWWSHDCHFSSYLPSYTCVIAISIFIALSIDQNNIFHSQEVLSYTCFIGFEYGYVLQYALLWPLMKPWLSLFIIHTFIYMCHSNIYIYSIIHWPIQYFSQPSSLVLGIHIGSRIWICIIISPFMASNEARTVIYHYTYLHIHVLQ